MYSFLSSFANIQSSTPTVSPPICIWSTLKIQKTTECLVIDYLQLTTSQLLNIFLKPSLVNQSIPSNPKKALSLLFKTGLRYALLLLLLYNLSRVLKYICPTRKHMKIILTLFPQQCASLKEKCSYRSCQTDCFWLSWTQTGQINVGFYTLLETASAKHVIISFICNYNFKATLCWSRKRGQGKQKP